MLLVLLAICLEAIPILENPSTSLINKHPRFVWLVRLLATKGISATRLPLSLLASLRLLILYFLFVFGMYNQGLQTGVLDEVVGTCYVKAFFGLEHCPSRPKNGSGSAEEIEAHVQVSQRDSLCEVGQKMLAGHERTEEHCVPCLNYTVETQPLEITFQSKTNSSAQVIPRWLLPSPEAPGRVAFGATFVSRGGS